MSCENTIEVVQQEVTIEQVKQEVTIEQVQQETTIEQVKQDVTIEIKQQEVTIEQVGVVLQKTVIYGYDVALLSELNDNILKNYVKGKFNKTDGVLNSISYMTSTDDVVYTKEFFRDGAGKMTHWILTRISDGETLRKNFSKNEDGELLFDYV